MVKSKKLIVSSLAIAGATLIASQHNLILNNSIFSNFTSPVVGFAAQNPEWAPHPEHGKVVDLDSEFSESGFLGTLYEDGTYIMRQVFNNKDKLYLDNPNGGIDTVFHGDSNVSKIKTFKIEGNIIADKLDLASSGMPSTIDLTGLTLSEKASMPFLSYRDDVLSSITFDPNFSLSNVRELSRMFDGSPNLKLSNEQVSQLLKNVRFDSYSERMFSDVGVERLDLSTFDNSRLKITESVANNGYEHEGHVFKNLIGLNEIVFGDSFSFENYNPKGTKLSFFDTNLSGVKKATLSGVGTGNHKFIKDWLTDVKNDNVENSAGLYRNGQFVTSVSEALKSNDDKVWESGVYTLGPVLNLNKKEPTVEHKAIPSPIVYEKDETRENGQPNIIVNGEPGDEVITTTYSVDPQTGTITPTVGKPIRVKEPTPTKVKVAAKDKVVEREIPNRTRYVKDSEKDFGTENETQIQGHPGREVTRTVYTVNPTDGSTTENTTTTRESEPQDKVIRVGGKTRTETIKDPEGRTVTTTTTYTVDETTGVVSPTITKSYGTQKDSTEVHKSIPSPVRYEKDITRNYGEPNQTQNGQPGDEVTTTTYSVNPQDGTITPTVGQPVRVKEPTETVVKVAAKDKVVENEIPNRTRYVKDSEKDYGTENEIQEQGQPGREVTRTVYIVNPNDGFVTESSTISRESDPQDKVVKVGGKTKTEIVNEGNQTYKMITSYDVNPETGEVTSSTTKELIPNENYNPSVEVDDTDPVTIPENNNSTPSLKPKDEEVKPKVEKETNKEILNGSFVESNIEKKDNNLDSNKEEKEKTSKDVLTIEKLQKDSLEKINLDNNVQTISLNKSNNVNKNLKLNQHSSTSTDSPKAEISTVNNKPTTEVNKVENVSSSTPSEKVEKTPTVKAPINTGSHSETNILPILGLIGLSGALIVGSSRKRKED